MTLDFKGHNKTIEKHNEVAVTSLENTDTIINDLYEITKSVPPSYHSATVHYYTKEGTELIGRKVLSEICKAMDVTFNNVDMDNFVSENYSSKNI